MRKCSPNVGCSIKKGGKYFTFVCGHGRQGVSVYSMGIAQATRSFARSAREERCHYLFGEKCPRFNLRSLIKHSVRCPQPCSHALYNPKLGRKVSSVYVSRHRFDKKYEKKNPRSDSAVGSLSPARLLRKSINKEAINS